MDVKTYIEKQLPGCTVGGIMARQITGEFDVKLVKTNEWIHRKSEGGYIDGPRNRAKLDAVVEKIRQHMEATKAAE